MFRMPQVLGVEFTSLSKMVERWREDDDLAMGENDSVSGRKQMMHSDIQIMKTHVLALSPLFRHRRQYGFENRIASHLFAARSGQPVIFMGTGRNHRTSDIMFFDEQRKMELRPLCCFDVVQKLPCLLEAMILGSERFSVYSSMHCNILKSMYCRNYLQQMYWKQDIFVDKLICYSSAEPDGLVIQHALVMQHTRRIGEQ